MNEITYNTIDLCLKLEGVKKIVLFANSPQVKGSRFWDIGRYEKTPGMPYADTFELASQTLRRELLPSYNGRSLSEQDVEDIVNRIKSKLGVE